MRRRDFLTLSSAGVLGAAALTAHQLFAAPAGGSPGRIAWQRHPQSGLFEQAMVDGQPLVREKTVGLLDAYCRPSDKAGAETVLSALKPTGACGAVRLELAHRLQAADGGSSEDAIEATLTLHNASDRAETVTVGFASGARPCPRAADQHVYLPISAGGLSHDPRLAELGCHDWPQDCHQTVDTAGVVCHYREPMASDPARTTTPALLLAPVVDVFHPQGPWRVAFFTCSLRPASFCGKDTWRMGHLVRLEPGERLAIRGYLYIHQGDAPAAWAAFQRLAHHEDFPPVDWLHSVRVHYFDFLSAATPGGRRGDGYDADLALFRDFRVGLATQHGYYPTIGDYIHPDRKQWKAMAGDQAGAARMSLDTMRERIKATRKTGARAAVYLHMSLFDDGSPLYEKLKDSVVVDAAGKRRDFGWQGPDTVKRTWKMSVASPAWREHLLGQARWIMELLNPDAIVMDETFASLGYDHHPQRRGPLSVGGIELVRKMRALVRSFGADKAFLVSDVATSNTVMWADGEVGDHAYDTMLGHPQYRKPPVRFLAALGRKPWCPCAWNFQKFWPQQLDLALTAGAGVGVTNGWLEYTGLAGLPKTVQRQMIQDVGSLPKT